MPSVAELLAGEEQFLLLILVRLDQFLPISVSLPFQLAALIWLLAEQLHLFKIKSAIDNRLMYFDSVV